MSDAIRNLYKVLKDNLSCYVYSGNFIDISKKLLVNSTTDLTNVATTFVITGEVDSSTDTLDFMKNRYIKFNDKYRRITNYVPTTNTVTLESTFGEVILSTDVMELVVLDSLFVDSLDEYPLDSQLWRKDFRIMFSCSLKTRLDWDKTKSDTYFDEIRTVIYKTYRLNIPIYNSTYTTIEGNLQIDSNSLNKQDISFLAKSDAGTGFTEHSIRFNGKYTQKY